MPKKITRILLVEDSESQRNLLYKILIQIPKVMPFPAEDGLEAYALLKALGNVDMILMDHNMPYVKGLDFIKKVKSVPSLSSIPIVVSSYEEGKEQFLEAGAELLLTKPYDLDRLREAIVKYTA